VLSFVRGMNNGTLLLKFQGWVWHDWVLDGVWVRGRWRCGEAKADFCKPRGHHVRWGWQNLGIRHNFWGLRWLWERLMRANLQERLHLVDELLHSMGLGQNIILAVAGNRRVNCCIHQLNFCGHICKLLLQWSIDSIDQSIVDQSIQSLHCCGRFIVVVWLLWVCFIRI